MQTTCTHIPQTNMAILPEESVNEVPLKKQINDKFKQQIT